MRLFHPENGHPTLKVVSEVLREGTQVFRLGTAPLNPDRPNVDLQDPGSARVMAIGYYEPETQDCGINYTMSEAVMLRRFWAIAAAVLNAGEKMIAFSTYEYELPFLVHRSWATGVAVPDFINGTPERPWNRKLFTDLGFLFQAGPYRDVVLPKALPLLLRQSEGEPFHALFHKGKEGVRQMSIALHLGWDCAQKMGVG